MRNILLAITSFFATVLILSQVAVAAEGEAEDGGDPKHTVAAQGEDPNLAATSSKTGTEAGVPNAGNDCPAGTCFPRTLGGRLGDHTVTPLPGGPSGTPDTSGSQGQKGSQ